MRRQRQFAQIDVFSPTPYLDNPVAVILDGEDLEDADMQRIARWTNLSETTLVLPPATREGDYRLRIFTPGGELPFAAPPTRRSGDIEEEYLGQIVDAFGIDHDQVLAHQWVDNGPAGPSRRRHDHSRP
jgi:PhzF family phenazine biosynthesis protein